MMKQVVEKSKRSRRVHAVIPYCVIAVPGTRYLVPGPVSLVYDVYVMANQEQTSCLAFVNIPVQR